MNLMFFFNKIYSYYTIHTRIFQNRFSTYENDFPDGFITTTDTLQGAKRWWGQNHPNTITPIAQRERGEEQSHPSPTMQTICLKLNGKNSPEQRTQSNTPWNRKKKNQISTQVCSIISYIEKLATASILTSRVDTRGLRTLTYGRVNCHEIFRAAAKRLKERKNEGNKEYTCVCALSFRFARWTNSIFIKAIFYFEPIMRSRALSHTSRYMSTCVRSQ